MERVKFAFLILHYQALDMTIKCVQQLEHTFDMSRNAIVIVDNGSPNGSGKELVSHYHQQKHVFVIKLPENVGFAKGNNAGFDFIKENLAPDFMIIMNNDVLIQQKEFLATVERLEKSTGFDVLGPDIYCPRLDCHQNPMGLVGLSYQQLEAHKKRYRKYLRFPLFFALKKRLSIVKRQSSLSASRKSKFDYTQCYRNPVLAGSCLIYAKKFIQKRNYAFNSGTFMFFEEEILHYECQKSNYLLLYSPELQVIHLDDVATDVSFRNTLSKKQWKYRESLKSIEVFETMMKQTDGSQSSIMRNLKLGD